MNIAPSAPNFGRYLLRKLKNFPCLKVNSLFSAAHLRDSVSNHPFHLIHTELFGPITPLFAVNRVTPCILATLQPIKIFHAQKKLLHLKILIIIFKSIRKTDKWSAVAARHQTRSRRREKGNYSLIVSHLNGIRLCF